MRKAARRGRRCRDHAAQSVAIRVFLPLWICVNFKDRQEFGLDTGLILHLREREEHLTVKISNLPFQLGAFSTGGRPCVAHQ